jgi:glycosyltransferase involved in cell wall biosynthesis
MISGENLVSVITPCYNAAPFVAETIEAVAAQRYPGRVEHIVLDDGSTDGSWSAIERFGDRVRAVRLPENRGGSHARNQGVALARGAYLMFLDADDVISPETIGFLVEAIRDRPGAIGACPWLRLQQAAGGEWDEAPSEIPFPLPVDALRAWMEGCWVPPCAILWRRDTYDRTGGWDERITLNDDGDLMMRALAGGAYIVPAAGGKALYRSHGEGRLSLSQDVFSPRRIQSMWMVWENLAAALERHGKLSAYQETMGLGFYRLALTCFQQGLRETGRRCLQAGERLAGRRVVARTRPGWLLTWLLGYEAKERVVDILAPLGIVTATRRRMRALRSGFGHGEPPS